jgi:site-specific DNA recombinase
MTFKIGVYSRVSTEEQTKVIAGSIQCQVQRCNQFVTAKNQIYPKWGHIISDYRDEGCSAKDTKRPAYQALLKDVRNKKVNLVLVSDLSRLSRNIADFSCFIEELQKQGASFLSIKEQFDSSTPFDELMIFNIINLAQFERKQTSERVAINNHTRSLQGMLSGGQRIFGYKKKNASVIVDKEEAHIVQKIFQEYIISSGFHKTAIRLQRQYPEINFSPHLVRRILQNIAYLGIKEVNKKYQHRPPEQLKPWQKYEQVKAIWPAIIDRTTFDLVQEKFKTSQFMQNRINHPQANRIYPLSGILKCSICHRKLSGQASHGRKKVYRYYGHSKSQRCKRKNIRADFIETTIELYLKQKEEFKKLLRGGNKAKLKMEYKKNFYAIVWIITLHWTEQ